MTAEEPKKKKLWMHLVSGMGAGAVSTVLLYPLDLLKTRYQVHETSARPFRSLWDGVRTIAGDQLKMRSLYRGMSPALLGATASWGLYFLFYERAKQHYATFQTTTDGKTSSLQHFLAGIEAGCICVPLTNPIWLIKVRMQVQSKTIQQVGNNTVIPYKNMSDAFRRIIAEEGVMALYKGCVPALLLTTHGAFKFMAYEKLKEIVQKNSSSSQLSTFHHLTVGALAQAFASTVTYPTQVVKARLQQGGIAATKYTGTINTISHIIRYEGVLGLYKGLTPNLVKVLPTGAIVFAAYEKIYSICSNFDLD